MVMNFTSVDPNSDNKTTQLDIYLAQYMTTYLIETSGNRFKVVDRKLGEATFAEDMKYEIQRRCPEEVLKDFQCDYYLTGKYILRYKKIDFVEISLNRGPIKEFSVSKSFNLTEEQNNDFKGISQEDIIAKFVKKLIEDLKTKNDPLSIFGAGVLERLLDEYDKSKTGDSQIFNTAKEAVLKYLLPFIGEEKK